MRSFVAMGDSFTEGLDDPYPGGSSYRGWADLVAARLAELAASGSAEARGGTFLYANLAIRGRLFDAVVDEQVPIGLSMRPDVFAFSAGGNDVLRRGFDPGAMLARYDEVVAALRATGAEVLLFRFVDLSRRLPAKKLLRRRIDVLNDGVMTTGRRYGARVVDLWDDGELGNPSVWSSDRLHLSAIGHRRVAAHALSALEVPFDPAWLLTPPCKEPLGWAAARAADAQWVMRHLGPWMHRRLTGQSSGDARAPKRPELAPLP